MSKFCFGNVTFTQNENHHLVMTSQLGGYALEFLDNVILGKTIPDRCSTVRSKDIFTEETTFTQV